ncbi:MAG: signal recognition particle-docking protein FtsY [Halothiobacillaceae bacterium]
MFGFLKRFKKGESEKTPPEQAAPDVTEKDADNADNADIEVEASSEPADSHQSREAVVERSGDSVQAEGEAERQPSRPTEAARPATTEPVVAAEPPTPTAPEPGQSEPDRAEPDKAVSSQASSTAQDTPAYARPVDKPGRTAEEQSTGGLFSRLRNRLAKTRRSFTEGLADLVLGKKTIDDELLEELETRLLLADVGMSATRAMIDNLTDRVSRKELTDPEALFEALYDLMVERLEQVQVPLQIPAGERPFVILMAGINGAGKTTTIGKLAHRLLQQDQSVMLAAGDTFRAAAVEQLQIWGERNGVPVIGQPDMRDAGAVMFDAVQAAQAREIDVLIADTAGRLHTQGGLMEELKKLTRVMRKVKAEAPQEVLLVLDASIGQNALNQARQFHEAIGVTGLVITKLDGTAKGGIVFAIAEELGLPIRFIGVGERPDDLRPFEARAYVDAMLDRERPDA